MNNKFIELMKQDVVEWQEAAKAVEELIAQMSEKDRKMWVGRAAHYRSHAKAMRELIEQLMKSGN